MGSLPNRKTLQDLLWTAAGIVRDATTLRASHKQLTQWLASTPAPTTVHAHETANLLQLGHALVTAALAREESRGAHFRSDFPEALEAQRHHLTLQQPQPTPIPTLELTPQN